MFLVNSLKEHFVLDTISGYAMFLGNEKRKNETKDSTSGIQKGPP